MRILIFIMYFFSLLASSQEYTKNEITIYHPILKITSESSKIGAGYFKIINNSNQTIFLKEIISNISKKLEIHEVVEEANTFKMRPVKKFIAIKAREELIFKSKSYHAMFLNFTEPLKDKDMVSAELVFSNNLIIPVKFKIILGNATHKHN